MDLRQLRHLVALADYRNFGRAAEAINLSQPAFSRSIQTLERDLDCELVERSSREFRLTGQGELVFATCSASARRQSGVAQRTDAIQRPHQR